MSQLATEPPALTQEQARTAAGGGGETAWPHWAKAQVKHWFSRPGTGVKIKPGCLAPAATMGLPLKGSE